MRGAINLMAIAKRTTWDRIPDWARAPLLVLLIAVAGGGITLWTEAVAQVTVAPVKADVARIDRQVTTNTQRITTLEACAEDTNAKLDKIVENTTVTRERIGEVKGALKAHMGRDVR